MAKAKNIYREKINKGLKKPDVRNITFRIPEELLEVFKKQCLKSDLKMNQVIVKMIEDYCK